MSFDPRYYGKGFDRACPECGQKIPADEDTPEKCPNCGMSFKS